jgi:low affinity Fe/Cu permease
MANTTGKSWFTRFANAAAYAAGRPITFVIAITLIVLWALSGQFFDYSDTWQLVINTSTTIITFLMVFLIQHTQSRDTETLQIKLDEVIRAIGKAQNAILDLDGLDDEQLHRLRSEYERLGKKARDELNHSQSGPRQVGNGAEQGDRNLEAEEVRKDEEGPDPSRS